MDATEGVRLERRGKEVQKEGAAPDEVVEKGNC